MMRWPSKIAANFVSDEIVHIVDLYNSLLTLAGCDVPDDRPVDGVNQLDFFFGKQEKSNREGFLFYIKDEMRAVKWRQWKMQSLVSHEFVKASF